MPPPFYKPVKKERFFRPNKLYTDINWNSFPVVVREFDLRIKEWYLDPVEVIQRTSGHYAFPVAAITCLLIDTVSQYFPAPPVGLPNIEGPGYKFKAFVKQQMNGYDVLLPSPIIHYRPDGTNCSLTSVPSVIYHALRCGMLHEARASIYVLLGGLPDKEVFRFEASGVTTYADNSP
jgi:hypothetical protein